MAADAQMVLNVEMRQLDRISGVVFFFGIAHSYLTSSGSEIDLDSMSKLHLSTVFLTMEPALEIVIRRRTELLDCAFT